VKAPAGFYLFVETNEKFKGGNKVFLTGPFDPSKDGRDKTTGSIGHTSHFADYNVGGDIRVVFAGELLVTHNRPDEVAAISARSGHYQPSPKDAEKSKLVEKYEKKFCGFCEGGDVVDFNLMTGACAREVCNYSPNDRLADCNAWFGESSFLSGIKRAVFLKKEKPAVLKAIEDASTKLFEHEQICGRLEIWRYAKEDLREMMRKLKIAPEIPKRPDKKAIEKAMGTEKTAKHDP
jgi:hypothetical protein